MTSSTLTEPYRPSAPILPPSQNSSVLCHAPPDVGSSGERTPKSVKHASPLIRTSAYVSPGLVVESSETESLTHSPFA